MLSESMEVFIREHEEEALELLRTIARIPAPSNHEEKRAEFCSRWLKEQGAEGVYIDEALNVVWPAVIREKMVWRSIWPIRMWYFLMRRSCL